MDDTVERIDCDVLVVGGGINGAGIARDAAGRGLRVVLCEKDDLAARTSSASSKLIHGGLRYLEHREFGLVRKALAERELLLSSAPHIMWPLRFVMPRDAVRPGAADPGRTGAAPTSARAAWSTRPAPGRTVFSKPRLGWRRPMRCAWLKAVTSSSGGCSTIRTPIYSSTRTGASCSPCRTNATSR